MIKSTTKTPLPEGILKTDLTRPSMSAYGGEALSNDWQNNTFDLWHVTGFGWCIPTLAISGKGARTYAIRIKDRNVVRIGMGPHVTEQVTVYVRINRLRTLQSFLDMRTDGAGKAGQVRDRISSRRAQGQIMRAEGRSSWRWNS